MYLLRVRLPEAPGSLGRVATAIGLLGASIQAVEIIGHQADVAIDDFIIDLPNGTMPDTIVSACQAIEGVRVLWVSHQLADWGVESDIAVLNHMMERPEEAAQTLTREAPIVFRSSWAALLTRSTPVQVLAATDLAPDFPHEGVEALGDLAKPRTFELPAEWLPHWGVTIIAMAPLDDVRTIVLGRQGGPAYQPSELRRLTHLAALANVG